MGGSSMDGSSSLAVVSPNVARRNAAAASSQLQQQQHRGAVSSSTPPSPPLHGRGAPHDGFQRFEDLRLRRLEHSNDLNHSYEEEVIQSAIRSAGRESARGGASRSLGHGGVDSDERLPRTGAGQALYGGSGWAVLGSAAILWS